MRGPGHARPTERIRAGSIGTGAEQLRAVLAEVLAEAPEPEVLEP